MKEDKLTSASEDNISLKDIILGFKKYFFEIVRKWWIILLLAIPLALYFGYKAINTSVTYSANNRFVIEGNDGGGLAGLGGLLGSFGIGKPSKTNPYKILEIALSTTILNEVLLDTITSKNNLLANEIIEKYELDKLWTENNPNFENFRFKTNDRSKWEVLDHKAYKRVIKFAIGTRKDRSNALYRIEINEDSGIYSIKCKTIDPEMSYFFSNTVFEKLKYHFENKTLEAQFQTKELLKDKKDSLNAIIDIRSRELALFEDRNRGLISSTATIKKNKILTEISGLSEAYQEAFKNYELADFSYNDNKPYFMLIDKSLLPLTGIGGSLIRNILIAIILAGFLGVLFIVLRRIYLDAMI